MNTVEAKVIAATAGSGLGAALSAFLLWIVGVFAFGASSAADQVPKALAAVPEPVGALLAILVAILGAFIGGYSAPHTSRPDLSTPLVFSTTTGTVTSASPVFTQTSDAPATPVVAARDTIEALPPTPVVG